MFCVYSGVFTGSFFWLFFFFNDLLNSFERQRERVREMFHLLACSSNGHNEARSFIYVSRVDREAQGFELSSLGFISAFIRVLDQKWSNWYS